MIKAFVFALSVISLTCYAQTVSFSETANFLKYKAHELSKRQCSGGNFGPAGPCTLKVESISDRGEVVMTSHYYADICYNWKRTITFKISELKTNYMNLGGVDYIFLSHTRGHQAFKLAIKETKGCVDRDMYYKSEKEISVSFPNTINSERFQNAFDNLIRTVPYTDVDPF